MCATNVETQSLVAWFMAERNATKEEYKHVLRVLKRICPAYEPAPCACGGECDCVNPGKTLAMGRWQERMDMIDEIADVVMGQGDASDFDQLKEKIEAGRKLSEYQTEMLLELHGRYKHKAA